MNTASNYTCNQLEEGLSKKDMVVRKINAALQRVKVPDHLTLDRAEYFKAGSRAVIAAVIEEIKSIDLY